MPSSPANRFHGEPTAAFCQLSLMAWAEAPRQGDIDAAWQVLDELDAGGPGALRSRLELLVASVIAGAALADSAEAVVQRATRRGEEDPEPLHVEAHDRQVTAR